MIRFPYGLACLLLLCSVQAAAHDPAQDSAPRTAQQGEPAAATPGPTREDTAQWEKAQREQMRREVEEATREIGAYSTARRVDAQVRARKAMDQMDARLQRLRTQWSREAQRIRAEAKAERERRDAQLREQRERVQARYRALEASNAAAWDQARKRFLQAYRELAATVSASLGPGRGPDKAQPPAKPRDPPAKKPDTQDRRHGQRQEPARP
jgi:TolA-binding protein